MGAATRKESSDAKSIHMIHMHHAVYFGQLEHTYKSQGPWFRVDEYKHRKAPTENTLSKLY